MVVGMKEIKGLGSENFFEILLDVAKPPGYRGGLIEEGEGSFVRLLIRASDEEEAVKLAKAYVESDGARLLSIEEVVPIDHGDQMPLEGSGPSRYEIDREIDDLPWEFDGKVKVVEVFEYMYDDEGEDCTVMEGSAEA